MLGYSSVLFLNIYYMAISRLSKENNEIKGLIINYISTSSNTSEKYDSLITLISKGYLNTETGEVKNSIGTLSGNINIKKMNSFLRTKEKPKKQRNFLTNHVMPSGKVVQAIKKGLIKVNIGSDIWLCGRQSYAPNPDKQKYGSKKSILHCVIYGPDNKEYHLYDTEVHLIDGGHIRYGNSVSHAYLKVYILTSILDKKENWCFDLTKIPPNGKLKVIYRNGTVKNIDFAGKFETKELISTRSPYYKTDNPDIKIDTLFGETGTIMVPELIYPRRNDSTWVTPIAYRKF